MNRDEFLAQLQEMPQLVLNLLRLTLQSEAAAELERDRIASEPEERAADQWLREWSTQDDPAPPNRAAALALFPRLIALGAYVKSGKAYGMPVPLEALSKPVLAGLLADMKPLWRDILRSLRTERN